MTTSIQFDTPPATDQPAPTTAEIAQQLAENPGSWAIVARADRLARAEAMAARITSGTEYGQGHDALVRKVGGEVRVYARRTA